MDSKFWAKVDKSGECWLWTGCTRPDGYGWVMRAGKAQLTHRYSYSLVSELPATLRHTCDVRACVKPAHLQPGTHQDNMVDMSLRGRGANQKVGLKGRQAIRASSLSRAELCRAFGVSGGTISRIINYKIGSQDPKGLNHE